MRAQSNAVIAGIGALPFVPYRDESTAAIANRAVSLALADAELERKAIDGLIVHIGSPRGLDVDEMAKLLALDIRFASETWSHGRFCGTIVQHAAMAIDHGLADYVVCVAAFRNSLSRGTARRRFRASRRISARAAGRTPRRRMPA